MLFRFEEARVTYILYIVFFFFGSEANDVYCTTLRFIIAVFIMFFFLSVNAHPLFHFSLLAPHGKNGNKPTHNHITQNYFVFSSTQCQWSSHTLTRTHRQKQISSLVKSFIGRGENIFSPVHVGRVADTVRSDALVLEHHQ